MSEFAPAAGPAALAERVARASYGRLVALLAARTRDIAAAEDALGDAFRVALEQWPQSGTPDQPEAWLLTVARRRLIDQGRQRAVHEGYAQDFLALSDELLEAAPAAFPDERLKLMFACTHPALEAGIRTPLMLQAVMGLDAARIASAFLIKPAAMGQRLARAKAKIRDAGIAFELPGQARLPERLSQVLDALYASYGLGWEQALYEGGDERSKGLAAEAIELTACLNDWLPGQPELMGLLALMCLCESRREARRDAAGEYVPLAEQDARRWSQPLMQRAATLLEQASAAGQLGRYQLEAAIQSVHAQRAQGQPCDWQALALLYEGLLRLAPSLGHRLGQISVLQQLQGPQAALQQLLALEPEPLRAYQPYWALRAHLMGATGRLDEARHAYGVAMGLSSDPAVQRFLRRRQAALG